MSGERLVTEEAPQHDDFDWAEPAARVPFTRIPTWVHDREDLTLYEKAAYAAVARFVSRKEGSTARPGVPALAAAAGCGETRMRDGLKGLVDKGILSIQRRGLGLTNRYRLRFTDPGPETSRGEDQEPHASAVADPHASEALDPHGVTRNQTRVNQDDDDARDATVESSVWEQVAEKLRKVPEWEHALLAGAELACFSVVEAEPAAPWVSIATRVAASRLDVSSGSIRTNSPRMALEFGLTDWRAGRMGGRKQTAVADRPSWDDTATVLRAAVADHGPGRQLDALKAIAAQHPAAAQLIAEIGWQQWCDRPANGGWLSHCRRTYQQMTLDPQPVADLIGRLEHNARLRDQLASGENPYGDRGAAW